jgi:hypothetical protein
MRLATDRLMLAESDVERDLATRWVTAWAGAIGELQFSAVVKGRFGMRERGTTGRNREGEFLIHSYRQLYTFIWPLSAGSNHTLENLMGKKSLSDDASESNETTEQALVALTLQIREFVQNRSLDIRFAAKLVKRLKKEADAVSDRGNSTKPGQKEMKKAFDAVDAVLRAHDAALLVTANAALRESDDSARTRKSQQPPIGG